MAYYVQNHKTVFVHISKAGGTSVTEWLKKNFDAKKIGPKHCRIDRIKNKNVDFDFHFTVVRNPFARVHSWYWYHVQGGHFEKIPDKWPHWKEAAQKGFVRWLEESSREGSTKSSIWWTQKSFIDTDRDYDACRLENINEEFARIQTRLNCFEPLPVSNTSNHEHYRKDYTSETRKIIEEHFQEDFEYFGYDF